MSFESRYGICLALPSTKADITLPKADKERLIFVASLRRSPEAPVFACLSLPAKSTKLSLPRLIDLMSSTSCVIDIISTDMVNIEWLLDESAFIMVAPVALFFHPWSINFWHSATSCTAWWDNSVTRAHTYTHRLIGIKNPPMSTFVFRTVYVHPSFGTLLQFQPSFIVQTQKVSHFFVVNFNVRGEHQKLYVIRDGYGFENVFKSPGYNTSLARWWVYALHWETLAASRLPVRKHRTVVTFQNTLCVSRTIIIV